MKKLTPKQLTKIKIKNFEKRKAKLEKLNKLHIPVDTINQVEPVIIEPGPEKPETFKKDFLDVKKSFHLDLGDDGKDLDKFIDLLNGKNYTKPFDKEPAKITSGRERVDSGNIIKEEKLSESPVVQSIDESIKVSIKVPSKDRLKGIVISFE